MNAAARPEEDTMPDSQNPMIELRLTEHDDLDWPTFLECLTRAVGFDCLDKLPWRVSEYAATKGNAQRVLGKLDLQDGETRDLLMFDWMTLSKQLAQTIAWSDMEGELPFEEARDAIWDAIKSDPEGKAALDHAVKVEAAEKQLQAARRELDEAKTTYLRAKREVTRSTD